MHLVLTGHFPRPTTAAYSEAPTRQFSNQSLKAGGSRRSVFGQFQIVGRKPSMSIALNSVVHPKPLLWYCVKPCLSASEERQEQWASLSKEICCRIEFYHVAPRLIFRILARIWYTPLVKHVYHGLASATAPMSWSGGEAVCLTLYGSGLTYPQTLCSRE